MKEMRIALMEERCCLFKYKVEVGDILSALIFIHKQDTYKTPDILFLSITFFFFFRERESHLENQKNKAASAFKEFIVLWEESEMKHFLKVNNGRL